jgi:hypothetical protein
MDRMVFEDSFVQGLWAYRTIPGSDYHMHPHIPLSDICRARTSILACNVTVCSAMIYNNNAPLLYRQQSLVLLLEV